MFYYKFIPTSRQADYFINVGTKVVCTGIARLSVFVKNNFKKVFFLKKDTALYFIVKKFGEKT